MAVTLDSQQWPSHWTLIHGRHTGLSAMAVTLGAITVTFDTPICIYLVHSSPRYIYMHTLCILAQHICAFAMLILICVLPCALCMCVCHAHCVCAFAMRIVYVRLPCALCMCVCHAHCVCAFAMHIVYVRLPCALCMCVYLAHCVCAFTLRILVQEGAELSMKSLSLNPSSANKAASTWIFKAY
jgi:hypothetical protein